jgi:hypothetical protein
MTQVQREYLEFLVNRRLNDLKFKHGDKAQEFEETSNLETLKNRLRLATEE